MEMTPTALLDSMQRVNELLQAGELRTAHDRLLTIVDEHPDYAEAQRLLGGAKLALGDAGGAERVLRRALKRDAGWTPTLTTLGELLLGSGRHAEAESFLQRAAAGKPPDPRAAAILARFYNDRRQPSRALAVLASFCNEADMPPELAIQHVTALVALGRSKDAIARYRAFVEKSPENVAAAQALVTALQAANRHGEAETIARRSLDQGPLSAALCYTHARSLTALGEFERAEAALRDCLKLEPQHVDAQGDLARLVWMRTGDVDAATAEFDGALRTFPHNDALWAARAAILQGAGDARGAFACLSERIGRSQTPPALLVRAGLAALEFDPHTALDLANRALRAVPGDAAARTLAAAAMLGVGDARGALPLCEALRIGSPDDQYLIALQTTAWRMLDDERYAQLCDYANLVVPCRLEARSPWSSLDAFLSDLKQSLGKLHDALRHPLLFQSLRHGTETTGDLTRSSDPVIGALFRAFDAPIRDYIARMGTGTDPLRRRRRAHYRFNGSWSVRLHPHGFHHNHVHPRGWISSACYIVLPETMHDARGNEGCLTFAEPGILTTPDLAAEHEVRPQPGMLVLFPSYFWHGTVPFSGDDTRLTVAFDVVPGPAV